ncbi:V8-like Glu-specific endopeptidase [Nonomuraea solani]|uniref:V8-like Glu-specific endopeptidase n=1 Tax=Nonomuraea solani TaxID=1144553 RepID=A0A1H6EMC1_9ACTN|nr:peptidase [Nonomuraea solani]SEG97939.1 V8-like Glu-specific endopeptidase [Nonomuraea solani]
MHRRVALVSAIALAVAGALVPASTAQAAGASAQAGTSAELDRRPVGWTATDSWSERRTVSSYWTSQRMLAAQPLSAPPPQRGDRLGRPSQGDPWSNGNSSVRRSSFGTRGAAFSVQPVNAQRSLIPNSPGLQWTDGGAVVRTLGRVFFTTADGQNSSCSGTAVTSANESVVMTAGHCVKLNGAAHRNWAFVPAFDDGRRPFGTWVGSRMLTTPQWNANEDINFDIAAVVVAPLQGRTLTDVVGGQGVAFNQARQRQMFAFGYPAADPFDGSELIYCSGRTFNDPIMTQDQGLRCNMTGGSSGGGWFLNFNEGTGQGMLNSVNSFTYNNAPNFMFGPFFGNEAMAVFQAAQNADAL